MQIFQVGALALLTLAPLHDAATFMAPRASLISDVVRKTKDPPKMPIMQHDKTAGEGYNEGSPMYEKQEDRKQLGLNKEPPPPPTSVSGGSRGIHEDLSNPHKIAEKSFCTVYGCGKDHWTQGLTFFLSYFIITMLVALIWKFCDKTDRRESWAERSNNKDGTFAYGLFSTEHCFGAEGHYGPVCFCSWCCAPLRIADTYSKQPFPIIESFWIALIVITCLHGLDGLTYGFSYFLFFCLAIYARQRIRQKYNLKAGGATYLYDCLSWTCCAPCTIAQEARQVDFVHPTKQPDMF